MVDINNTTSTRSVIFSYFSKMTDIYGEVEKWKQDYLYILQSSITVPTGDLMDGLEVKLYGGNTVSRHEKEASIKSILSYLTLGHALLKKMFCVLLDYTMSYFNL